VGAQFRNGLLKLFLSLGLYLLQLYELDLKLIELEELKLLHWYTMANLLSYLHQVVVSSIWLIQLVVQPHQPGYVRPMTSLGYALVQWHMQVGS
jgi:hypothetical protein